MLGTETGDHFRAQGTFFALRIASRRVTADAGQAKLLWCLWGKLRRPAHGGRLSGLDWPDLVRRGLSANGGGQELSCLSLVHGIIPAEGLCRNLGVAWIET